MTKRSSLCVLTFLSSFQPRLDGCHNLNCWFIDSASLEITQYPHTSPELKLTQSRGISDAHLRGWVSVASTCVFAVLHASNLSSWQRCWRPAAHVTRASWITYGVRTSGGNGQWCRNQGSRTATCTLTCTRMVEHEERHYYCQRTLYAYLTQQRGLYNYQTTPWYIPTPCTVHVWSVLTCAQVQWQIAWHVDTGF